MKKDIMEYFPFAEPRGVQEKVIRSVKKALDGGKRYIILQAPVGSGKSVKAVTLAEALGSSHMLTPRKALQDQYHEDFSQDTNMALMKGRAAYPCTFPSVSNPGFKVVSNLIRNKKHLEKPHIGDSTAKGLCTRTGSLGKDSWAECTGGNPDMCPYAKAINVASESTHIVHNFHSFIFQTMYTEKFSRRDVLIVDEAHDITETLRDFISRSVRVKYLLSQGVIQVPASDASIDDWVDFLENETFIPQADFSEESKEKRAEYLEKCKDIRKTFSEKAFVVSVEENDYFGTTTIKFIPISIGDAAERLIFSYGDKVILMSGTIYDKEYYCGQIGIDPSDAAFINVGSTFPVENRPIYMKKKYMLDTSFKYWEYNLPKLAKNIHTVMDTFKGKKGLIHVSSYRAMDELTKAVDSDRLITHTPETFHDELESFYNRNDDSVFVSPICQQGVDMKGDRALFQIITRVPYQFIGDTFTKYMVKHQYQWYNYQALIVFGQMIGRINRSEKDFGATILMDERFVSFIAKNRYKIPEWVLRAIKE